MTSTWILVANSSFAQIFQTFKAKLFQSNGHYQNELKPIHKFYHYQSRLKNSELISDKFGNYQGGVSGHSCFVEASDPKDLEVHKFAHEIADFLNDARLKREYDDLVIISNPHFQGILQNCLNNQTERLITATIGRDYTNISNKDLIKRLREQI